MRRVLLVVGLCLALVSRAGAQATATPKPFVTSAQAAVLYPQAIRFTLTTDLPAGGIESASLLLSTDHPLDGVDVDVKQAETKPGTLDVVWTIPTDPAPRLFQPIHASWSITAGDGRHQQVDADVTLADPRVEWVGASNEAGTLTLTAPTSMNDLNAVLRTVQPVLKQFYPANAPAFNWLVYPPNVPPGCPLDASGKPLAINGVACDPAHAQALYNGNAFRLLTAEAATANGAINVVSADIIDARFGANWKAAKVPDWFRYGFATFFTPSRKTALLAPAVAAARGQQLVSTDRLTSVAQHDDLWRAESYGLVLYLAGRTGVNGLMALADQFSADAPFQPTFEAALGQSLTELVPSVQRWLLTDAAASAYNYVPYGAPTPTPSPTASPSATATTPPTATATPTPSRTPQPTLRSTWTPIPPTPTITPRPANSLALWTPVPTAGPVGVVEPAPSSTSPLMIVVLVLAAVVLVGLVALYIRLGRRR